MHSHVGAKEPEMFGEHWVTQGRSMQWLQSLSNRMSLCCDSPPLPPHLYLAIDASLFFSDFYLCFGEAS